MTAAGSRGEARTLAERVRRIANENDELAGVAAKRGKHRDFIANLRRDAATLHEAADAIEGKP